MRNSDLPVFSQYLVHHQMRRPPDHLVVEWYAGETEESKIYKSGRVNIGFKFNLFDHIGSVSTLRKEITSANSFPHCFDQLLVPTVFEVEAYNPIVCPHEDIWPCRGKQSLPVVDWAAMLNRH